MTDCLNLDRGTVKVVSWDKVGNSTTIAVDTCRVERKMNHQWKTAEFTSNGYTFNTSNITNDYGDTIDIYFERGTTSLKRFSGFIVEESEVNNGKNITQRVELYGREHTINFAYYQASSNPINAQSYIDGMLNYCGIGSTVIGDLQNTTMYLKSGENKRKLIVDRLRDLNTSHTINYFFDNNGTLNSFYGNKDTSSTTITNFIVRDKVVNVKGIFNSINLITSRYCYEEDPDYFTEDSFNGCSVRILNYPTNIYHLYNHHTDDIALSDDTGNYTYGSSSKRYAAGTLKTNNPLMGGSPYDRIEAFAVFDLGQSSLLKLSAINAIEFDIAYSHESNLDAWTIPMETKIILFNEYTDNVLPITAVEDHSWTGNYEEDALYVMQVAGKMVLPDGHLTYGHAFKSVGTIHSSLSSVNFVSKTVTTSNWSHVNTDSQQAVDQFRYLGVWSLAKGVDLPNDQAYKESTIYVNIDHLSVRYLTTLSYKDLTSDGLYGSREYIDTSGACRCNAESAQQLLEKAVSIIYPKSIPEQSIRKLSFPGSLDVEVGIAYTLTFEDYTKAYTSQEITDVFDGKDWHTEMKLSSSPITIPKTALPEKIREMDANIKDLTMLTADLVPDAFMIGAYTGIDTNLGKIISNAKRTSGFDYIIYIDGSGHYMCNGPTSIDATDDITEMFNAICDELVDGGSIYFCPGVYEGTDTLVVKYKISIFGSSRGTSTLKITASDKALFYDGLTEASIEQVSIKDLKLDLADCQDGLHMLNCTSCTVENFAITNLTDGYTGISVYGQTDGAMKCWELSLNNSLKHIDISCETDEYGVGIKIINSLNTSLSEIMIVKPSIGIQLETLDDFIGTPEDNDHNFGWCESTHMSHIFVWYPDEIGITFVGTSGSGSFAMTRMEHIMINLSVSGSKGIYVNSLGDVADDESPEWRGIEMDRCKWDQINIWVQNGASNVTCITLNGGHDRSIFSGITFELFAESAPTNVCGIEYLGNRIGNITYIQEPTFYYQSTYDWNYRIKDVYS